jgi:hypothetical protein
MEDAIQQAESFQLFVPEKVADSLMGRPPGLLPVEMEDGIVANAVYQDYHYSFTLPRDIAEVIDDPEADLRFVYRHDLFGESFEAKPGSQLVRVQIEPDDKASERKRRDGRATGTQSA